MDCSDENSSKLATAKTILTTAASVAAALVVARSVAQDLFPDELRDGLFSGVKRFCTRHFSSKLTIVIEEYEGLEPNKLYEAATAYLATKISPSTRRIRVYRPEKEARFGISIEPEQEIADTFDRAKIKWELSLKRVESNRPSTDTVTQRPTSVRFLELSFHRKHKDTIIGRYLPYVEERAKVERQERRTLKLFTLSMDFYGSLSEIWNPVNLDHPSTFETLAMDSTLKETILEDLERFVRRKEYYRRVGKAWKRGYLLYGPPGTGKSSLVAAMANYLKFDVYDLDLSGVSGNWELRRALVATVNRSILVVEDIDCNGEFSNRSEKDESGDPPGQRRQRKITLSGLLNFTDGLWSSCGDERIVIFTTNYKEKLDPALLRPGRMDMHVHMSYCMPDGFRLLASNYLGVKQHLRFDEIEDLIRTVEVTPAELAEELMKGDDADKVLSDVVELLKGKKNEKNENEVLSCAVD